MDVHTATEIAELTCTPRARLIEAIKLLRTETSFGLLQAKEYLERHRVGGQAMLFKALCSDFVMDKKDLIIQTRAEIAKLTKYLEQLEAEVAAEIEWDPALIEQAGG